MKHVVQDKSEYWQQHIDSAKKYPGGTQKYCLSQGLNASSFYAWRKKLLKSTKKPSSFLPMIVSENPSSQIQPSFTLAQLPDAIWAVHHRANPSI